MHKDDIRVTLCNVGYYLLFNTVFEVSDILRQELHPVGHYVQSDILQNSICQLVLHEISTIIKQCKSQQQIEKILLSLLFSPLLNT